MENIISHEVLSVVSDPTFRLTAERLVIKTGVRADLKGFKCLVDAVILYGTERFRKFSDIYAAVGAVRRLKHKTVMREISYAIAQAFGLPARLSALVGVDIPPADIHSGLVIAYLGSLFKNPDVAVYA